MAGRIRQCIIALFTLALINGCYFPVGIDELEYDECPVVNCLFTPSKPFCVYVCKTASMLDTAVQVFDNAVVRILTGNDTVAVLPAIGGGYYRDEGVFPKSGVFYTLQVEVPGYDMLQASDSIPSVVSNVEYTGYELNAWMNEEGFFYDGLNFIIHDTPADNYYEFTNRCYYKRYDRDSQDTINVVRIGSFKTNDPVVTQNDIWQTVFSDVTFNGVDYPLQVLESVGSYRYNNGRDHYKYEVEVIQGSSIFYTYRLTYLKHDEAQYADFWDPMEPIIMYSNIENGYGIFAGYYAQTIETDYIF
ncbi:MAG: DUF4249 domain-containing protein [Prolixibacteraceae bacterium]|nr:DUF4249 domain-containing protein [Prolixibacteraceae bacterium]